LGEEVEAEEHVELDDPGDTGIVRAAGGLITLGNRG
jgi:hypothetical protein